MPVKLKKLPDQTFVLDLNIPSKTIQKHRQQVLKDIQKNFTLAGFRPGKVPLSLVQQHTPESKIIEKIISRLIPPLYQKHLVKHQLKPIIQPQVKFKKPPQLNHSWQIEITACQLPRYTLKPAYLPQIKKINRSAAKNKTQKIVQIITQNTQVTLPSILIQTQIQNHLARLVDQTQQAGLNINQYLSSKNLTLEQYRLQLQNQIESDWALSLALNHIARQQKIKVTPQDIKKTKTPANTNPTLLAHLLLQQKVLNFLASL